MITAAYNVSLGKDIGVTAFKNAFEVIDEKFGYTPEYLKARTFDEQIRLITAAYAVSIGKEEGVAAFKNAFEIIDEKFGYTPEYLKARTFDEQIRLITAYSGQNDGVFRG